MASEDGCIQSKKFQSVNIRNIRSDDILLNNDSDIPSDGSFDGMIKITDRGTNIDNFEWSATPPETYIKADKLRDNYCLLNLETKRKYKNEPNSGTDPARSYLNVPSILKIKIPEGDTIDHADMANEDSLVEYLYKTNINAIDIENADIKFQQTSETKELVKEQKIKKKTSQLTGNNFSIVIENEDKTHSEEGRYTNGVLLHGVPTGDLPNNCLKIHNELGYIELKSEIHSRGKTGTWNLPGGAILKPDPIPSNTVYHIIQSDSVSHSQIRTNGEIVTSIKVKLTNLIYDGTSGQIDILGPTGSYIAKYDTLNMGLLYRYTINVIKPESGTSTNVKNLLLAFGGATENEGASANAIIPSPATLGQFAPTAIDTLTAAPSVSPSDMNSGGSKMHLVAVGASGSHNAGGGTFVISGSADTVTTAQFIIGTQLAITIQQIGNANDITGVSGGQPVVGDVYFTTVKTFSFMPGAPNPRTGVLSMAITDPTTLTGKVFTGIQSTTVDATTAKIRIVTGDNGIKLDLHKKGSMTEINNFVNDYTNGENLSTDSDDHNHIYLATNDYTGTAGTIANAVVMIKLYGFEEP